MAPNRILILEDELNVGQTLVERLAREKFAIVWAKSIQEARELLKDHEFDLAILDVSLPDGSGFDLAIDLRRKSPLTSLMFLSAFGSPEDRVRGLELGADDYVAKPFHLKELLLRIQVALRNKSRLELVPRNVKIGKAIICFDSYEARVADKTIPLGQKECDLLRVLVERRGQVVSRDTILDEVWSESQFPTARTVDNFVLKIRRLIEEDPENPRLIRNIRGVGYKLEPEEA